MVKGIYVNPELLHMVSHDILGAYMRDTAKEVGAALDREFERECLMLKTICDYYGVAEDVYDYIYYIEQQAAMNYTEAIQFLYEAAEYAKTKESN